MAARTEAGVAARSTSEACCQPGMFAVPGLRCLSGRRRGCASSRSRDVIVVFMILTWRFISVSSSLRDSNHDKRERILRLWIVGR